MKLFHITCFDKPKQDLLKASVPELTTLGENINIKRISFAPSIEDCIKGIYNSGYFYKKSVNIRVYISLIEENDPNLICWDELYKKGFVDDACLIHEFWYLKDIRPDYYREYAVNVTKEKWYIIVRADLKSKIVWILNNMGEYSRD